MQALVLLLWTGALLGLGRCQNAGPEAVSRSWARWGPGAGWLGDNVSHPSPALSGSMGRLDSTQAAGQALVFQSRQGLGFSKSQIESASPCLSEDGGWGWVGEGRSKKVKVESPLTSASVKIFSLPCITYGSH